MYNHTKEIQAYYQSRSLSLLKYNFFWFLSHLFCQTKLGKKADYHRDIISRSLMPQTTEKSRIYDIEEINVNDLSRIDEHLKTRNPFIIRRLLTQDMSASGLSFDYLVKQFGEEYQPVFPNSKRDIEPNFLKVKDIVSNIKKGSLDSNIIGGNLIYNNQLLRKKFQDLFFKKRMFYKCSFLKLEHLFLSCAGTHTKCHSEFGDNFFLQIKGQKKWTIYKTISSYAFKPLNLYRLYLYANQEQSQVLPNSDLSKIPHYEAILNEGDLLYNPSFHWHYVETLKSSICVSMRFSRLTTLFKNPLMSFFILTARNPNIFKQFIFRSNTNPNKV